MAKICAKHDVLGDECWCCEEEKLDTKEKRAAAYRSPEFLKKRGGLDAGAVQRSAVLDKLSTLSPEQIEKLVALAGGGAPPSASSSGVARRVVA